MSTFIPVSATAAVGDAYLTFSEIRELRREGVLLRVAATLAGVASVAMLAGACFIR